MEVKMKGVNKLVLEIKPDGEYFEKALLFLKPGSAEFSQSEISEGAERLLGRVKENKQKKKRNGFNAFLWTSMGAFLMWITMFVIDKIC